MTTAAMEQFAEENDLGAEHLDPHYRNDVGYADAFAHRFEGRLKYIAEEGAWLVFDARKGWHRDTSGEVKSLQLKFAREIYRDACQRAAKMTDAKEGASIIAAAARLGDKKRTAPALDFASVNQRLVVRITDLDADPMLLGTQNGVVDLRDGSFRGHAPEILVTRSCACDYAAGADCPTFLRFLEEVQPHPEMRGFLQRLCGYTLTGLLGEHILPFHFGLGANGKGTFFEQVVFKILGNYASKLTDSLVYLKGNGSPPHLEIAGLCGIRFALGEENEEGGKLNEALLKKMTGGDRQKGRFHYKPFFEYEPTAKIHLVGNHKPRIGGRDDGIWRRFQLVDWAVKIPDARKDLRLWQKLQPEFAGILNWMIEGALALGDLGTHPPASVFVATAKFREDSDAFGDFLREKTIDDLGPAGEIPKSNLFELYKEYCAEQDIPARAKQSKRRIGFLMIERSYEEGKNAKGIRVWRGIRERTEEDNCGDLLDLTQRQESHQTTHGSAGEDELGEKTAVASNDEIDPYGSDDPF